MRTNEERQQLIHRRTLEIQREQQKKRERVISGSGIAACLVMIIGIGCLMPEVTKQASASGAKTNYTTGMALSQYPYPLLLNRQKLIIQQEWLVCWEIMRHLDTFVWEFWHLHLVFV